MQKSEQEILQRRLSQFLVDDVFNTISEDDILKQLPDGSWTYKGNVMAPGIPEALMKEAQVFSKMGLFQILQDEMRYHARRKLEEAVTESDIICAKLLSYFVDVFKSKVRKLAELKKPEIKKVHFNK